MARYNIQLSLLLFHIIDTLSANVLWTFEPDVIRIGKTLSLVCTVADVDIIDQGLIRQWTKGPELICYNGHPIDPIKYSEIVKNDNQFKVQINNVTESDLQCNYKCRYSFETQTKKIKISRHNFKGDCISITCIMERKFFLLYYGQRRKKISVTDGINFNVIHESVKNKFNLNDVHLQVFDSDVGDYIDLDSDADLNFEAEQFIEVRIINASKGVLSPDSQIVPGAATFNLSPLINKSTKPLSGSISGPFLNDISTCFSSPTSSKINSLSSLENRGSDVPNTRKERSIQDSHRRLITTLTEHIDDTIDEHEFKSFRSLFNLTPKDNKAANDMSSLLSILERKDMIAPGKYEKLKEALSGINVKIIRDVIEPIEDKIRLESDISTFQEHAEIVPYSFHESEYVRNGQQHMIYKYVDNLITNYKDNTSGWHSIIINVLDQKVCRSPGKCSPETVPAYTLNSPGPDYKLKIWLTKVALELDANNLDAMNFILKGEDGSPSSVLEKISSPWQLFGHLIDNGKLARDNILFLQAMLYHARKIDLYKKLMEYGKIYKDTLHFYEPTSNQVASVTKQSQKDTKREMKRPRRNYGRHNEINDSNERSTIIST